MSGPISRQHNFSSVSNGCSKKRKDRPAHKGSALLSAEENSQLFEVLGRDRISLVAGIAQLLDAPAESPNVWRKTNVGIVYLVKDYRERNYQLCMYDIFKKELQWSQILYKDFAVNSYSNCPRLLVFECDTCIKALNFTDFNEAEEFKVAMEKRRESNQKSQQGRRGSAGTAVIQNQRKSPAHPSHKKTTAPCFPPSYLQDGIQSSHYHQQHPVGGITSMGVMPHFGLHHLSTKKTTKKDKDGKKRKVTKEDIGIPTDFVHKAHIGWDGNTYSASSVGDAMDEKFLNMCQKINEDPNKMDQEELGFALEFYAKNESKYPNENIGGFSQNTPFFAQNPTLATRHQPPPRPPPVTNNVIHSMNEFGSQQQQAIMAYSPVVDTHPFVPSPPQRFLGASLGGGVQPPSKPSIAHQSQVMNSRGKPPPPPTPPTVIQQQKEQSPPAPPQQRPPVPTAVNSATSPPPPPPPPPLFQSKPTLPNNSLPSTSIESKTSSVDPTNNKRSDLLQQIQQGTKLKKVGPPSAERTPVPTNAPTLRDNMMEQIKQGTTLKHVDASDVEINRRSVGSGVQEIGGLAGALAKALEERRRNIMNSEDSSDSDSETNNDEWDDDQE
ncbi:hypothetical protein niasHS_012246 [Heterodera schachtii]|uniref:Uncharacterized protein n=1 Tax=Heterodera schachtii TaxID=97005 RepID=A0ABD2II58_HETSC